MIKVVVAEDHNALIDGIRLFLEYEDDIALMGYANNGRELLDLIERKTVNVVITDIRMPVMDGIEATRTISKKYPNIKVIAFTMFDQDDAVNEMLEAGAKGYILKNSPLKTLLNAIRLVANGEHYYDTGIAQNREAKRAKYNVLTARQIDILKLIALGKNNLEIAETLFIGKTTVETHRKNMIRALNLHGPGELLRYALERKYDF